MADNLSVSVTADTSQLVAKLALAQADVRAFSAEVRKSADDMRAAGGGTAEQSAALIKLSAQLAGAKTATAGLRAEMAATTPTIASATHLMQGHSAATEAMVLAHEAMSGRFSKMGGSLMILTQRLAGGSVAMMAFAGAIGVAAMGAMHLKEWLDKVAAAKLLAEAGGVGSGISTTDIDAQVSKLRQIGPVTSEQAGQSVHAFASMRGASKEVIDELTSDVYGLALRMGQDVPNAAARIVEAWNLDAKAGADLLDKTRSAADVVQAFNKAAGEGDAVRARTILLQELARSQREVETQTRLGLQETQAETNAREMAAQLPFTPEQAASTVQQGAAEDAAGVAQRLAAAIAHIKDTVKAPDPLGFEEGARQELDQVVLGVEKAGHAMGESWQKIHEQMSAATVGFWQKELALTQAGTKNHALAESELLHAEEALEMQRIKIGEAGAKQSLEAQVAALSAEQAAARDDFNKVIDLEHQKLALLAGAYGQRSKQYQDELKVEENLERQHQQQLTTLAMEGITQRISNDRQLLATKKSELDEEVAYHEISKRQEFAALQAFADQQYMIEHQALTDLIATLTAGTAEYQKAMAQRTALETSHAREAARLNADAAQQTEQAWSSYLNPVKSAFDGMISSMLQGHERLGQAAQRAAGQVLESFIKMAVQSAEQWVEHEAIMLFATESTETAKTAATATQSTVRIAAQIAADSTALAAALTANEAQAQSYAAVGGTAAGASVAAIPFVGWAMAPGVAASTYGELAALGTAASYESGTDYVPNTGYAYIHQGEAVLNRGDAAAWRAGDSNSSSVAVHYNPQFYGSTPAGLPAQSRAEAEGLKSMLWNMTRNGNLRLPGR